MTMFFTPQGLHCPKTQCYVSLEQTEACCRAAHGCGPGGICPLAEELGCDRIARTIAALAKDCCAADEFSSVLPIAS